MARDGQQAWARHEALRRAGVRAGDLERPDPEAVVTVVIVIKGVVRPTYVVYVRRQTSGRGAKIERRCRRTRGPPDLPQAPLRTRRVSIGTSRRTRGTEGTR